MRIIGICLLAFVGIGFAHAADPVNDRDKTLYALGVAVSQGLGDFSLTEAELDELLNEPDARYLYDLWCEHQQHN